MCAAIGMSVATFVVLPKYVNIYGTIYQKQFKNETTIVQVAYKYEEENYYSPLVMKFSTVLDSLKFYNSIIKEYTIVYFYIETGKASKPLQNSGGFNNTDIILISFAVFFVIATIVCAIVLSFFAFKPKYKQLT